MSKPHLPLSPRRRRLRKTVFVLAVVGVLSLGGGGLVYRLTRPRPYVPGEEVAGLTSQLSKQLPPGAPEPRFLNVTGPAGLDGFRNFSGERSSQLPEDMGPGLAWGDFDRDGDDDLFLVSAGGALTQGEGDLLPCRLYENLGDGTFRMVTDLPEIRIHGLGVAWGDYDGDGFLDLALSGYNALLLLHNQAKAEGRVFVQDDRFASPPGFWSGLSWGDFDNDRDLDLYVCNYVQYQESLSDRQRSSDQLGTFVPYTLNPASYRPGLNRLFRNNGHGVFTEVAEELGVTNPTGRSLGGLWHDFDDDGWLDLYVANDVSDNVFYHNLGGKFEDISHAAWVADYRSAMGLAAGDWNRDGDDDLFITHWVAQENALYDNLLADSQADAKGTKAAAVPSPLQPGRAPAPSYSLRFVDVNELRGLGQIALPFVGWGTEFVDLDADGWLDLLVANGNTIEEDGPSPKRLKAQVPFLFWNQHGDYFHDLAPLQPALAQAHVSRGLAVTDYDNDGRMDFVIAHLGEGVQLFRNEMQTGHWLKIRLRSKNRDGRPTGFGDGAKVIAQVGPVVLRRTVSSVSYLSQSSRTLHFGLGAATTVDRLEIRWLGGNTNVLGQLQADTLWEITEDDPQPKPGGPPPGNASRAPLSTGPSPTTGPQSQANTNKTRLVEFWAKHRAAMDALKIENDPAKAIPLFRAALDLNPQHEDARYYLGQCLVIQGDPEGALAQLRELTRINPQSHRGFQQWGVVRALHARSAADLASAEDSLQRAHALNPEETGALLALGEISVLRHDGPLAEQRFQKVCTSNPRAAGGWFLRGYLAWKQGDSARAGELLAAARKAFGPDWQPKGATSEGDVKKKQHAEQTPLSRFYTQWNGETDPRAAFAELEAWLRSVGG